MDNTGQSSAESAVVVGVDGSERNQAAVDYAVAEAARDGRMLLLVTAVDESGAGLGEGAHAREHTSAMLESVRGRVLQTAPDSRTDVRVHSGNPAAALVDSAPDHGLLIVGKRGVGALQRLLVGSTSMRTAARADVPVVVVPVDWRPPSSPSGPVVVGVDPAHPHVAALRFAFDRAQRDGVPLRAVHAVPEAPDLVLGVAAVSMDEVGEWEGRSAAALDAALAEIRDAYPDVEVDVVRERGHAADLLLEQAANAQLIVLGRRHHGPVIWGLGSVAREVLHAAEVPVAVVPLR